MDTQNNAGKLVSRRQYVFDTDVRGQTFSYFIYGLAYARQNALRAILKTIAKGDLSLESALLRRWGIRRSELATTLPHDPVRPPELHEGADPDDFWFNKE